MNFVDEAVVVNLNDEKVYVDEVERLAQWCLANNLFLNISNTKELVVDFRSEPQRTYTALMINLGGESEQLQGTSAYT